ncbi:hypothetical protein GH714_030160 [Hevea brasiliensis]|uniref:HhH-GPD domain-containing protein n=1 Tax=Hevea brasiliensis TaxID=3981 RepID=A0A6A6MLU4_HEVBR|nr:hypothetical protein GH714_030160 [Hevea brasiliensis]
MMVCPFHCFKVLAAESKCIENAIRCGGLAPTKASCIKNILSSLLEKNGKLCLEYLRDLSVEEIKAELSHFKGIGPKTVSCVLLFQLQLDDFPVDTHVFEIAKAIGWVPGVADRNKAYLHLNQRIPNELKFDLNCLLFTHALSGPGLSSVFGSKVSVNWSSVRFGSADQIGGLLAKKRSD